MYRIFLLHDIQFDYNNLVFAMTYKKVASLEQITLPGVAGVHVAPEVAQIQQRNTTPITYYLIIAIFVLFAGDVAI
jgi:hypothetical protein